MKYIQPLAMLAVPAICLSLTSCSRDYEEYLEAATSLAKEAADILNDCEGEEDADATADKILKLAKKMEDLRESFLCSYADDVRSAIIKPELSDDMQTKALANITEKHREIQSSYRDRNMHWKAAVTRINSSETLSRRRYLDYAIRRFTREYDSFIDNSNIFGS